MRHLDGIEQILVIYPYVVEGGFTVVSQAPDPGPYDAHFGMILTEDPAVCHQGYEGTNRRPPQDGSNAPDERGRPLHRAADARATPVARRTSREPAPPTGHPWRPTTPTPASSAGVTRFPEG